MSSRRAIAAVAVLATVGCSWTFVSGPPSRPSRAGEELDCSTSYRLPIGDGLAGGVLAAPIIARGALGLWDVLYYRSNGKDAPHRDWNNTLLVTSALGALVFSVAMETGRSKVYACRRAKGLPLEGEDITIKRAEDAARLQEAKRNAAAAACAASVPAGNPGDVRIADEHREHLVLCPVDGAAVAASRGGSLVIRGDAVQHIGGLPGCERYSGGCSGFDAGQIRRAIDDAVAADPYPSTRALAIGQEPPLCAAMGLEREMYVSVTDWSSANALAPAVRAVVRETRLSPQDAIVITVVPPCLWARP
jgi:hypothetical protein